jgi:hypothetical protein
MVAATAYGFSASAGLSRAQALARLERLARFLDTAIAIPGTRIRFGADTVVGLVPGVGDAITTLASAYLIYEAHRLGVPKHLLARMIGNVAFDAVIGAVPVLGDVADMFWRANTRNIRLLREHLSRN